jgi:ribosome-binding factor A
MAHRKRNRRREHIKDAQLCAAVRETLSLALAQSTDDLLLSLFVTDVVPAPDATRLAVHLEASPGVDLEDVRAALDRVGGRLRAEVAASINRRKTPALFFDVRPSGDATE